MLSTVLYSKQNKKRGNGLFFYIIRFVILLFCLFHFQKTSHIWFYSSITKKEKRIWRLHKKFHVINCADLGGSSGSET